MKHDAALRALMGESKAQQKQRLQERLEKLRKLKQEGGEVNEEEVVALEQVEAEGVDAVDAEVLNHLIEESVTDTEEVTTNTLLNDLQVSLTPFPPPPPSVLITNPCLFEFNTELNDLQLSTILLHPQHTSPPLPSW